MKQIAIDHGMLAKLKAANPDVDPTKITVFRAAALSTAPVRKKHPLFEGAIHSVDYLNQMRDTLSAESIPLQIMHGSSDGDQLPIGRIFHGEISPNTGVDGATELVTEFWIDNTHAELIAKVNSGTIDQVSVATLAKKAVSSKTGFNFAGPEAGVEHIWGGVDDKGNKMGVDGNHVQLLELDKWFEMSLVGQGGAQGAKIRGANQLRLSATNQDVPALTLELSTGPAPAPKPTPPTPEPAPKKDDFAMEAKDFAAIIAENAGKLALAENAKTSAETALAAANAEIATLKGQVATLSSSDNVTKLTAAEASVADLTTKLTAAEALPKKLLAPLFTSLGQVNFELPADEAAAVTLVKDAVSGVKDLGTRLSSGTAHNAGFQGASAPSANAAFKRRA